MSCATLFLIAFLLLFGCSAGGAIFSEGFPFLSQNNPAASLGIKEDTSTGLKGTDANYNGIRDDIDQLIEKKYSVTQAIKKAAEQDAKATQKMMEATTKTEAFEATELMDRAIDCEYSLPDFESSKDREKLQLEMSREIEALTANTRERFKKYLQSNKLVGGGYFTQGKGPFCD
ncbi:MAG: hypothetical protein HY877_01915 [Deltaproteobacteria bacterium]|nr:hypothetical protein [Deltaproteobacteria bacterium]